VFIPLTGGSRMLPGKSRGKCNFFILAEVKNLAFYTRTRRPYLPLHCLNCTKFTVRDLQCTSVRGQVRSPHTAKLQAASVPIAYGNCAPRVGQTDGQISLKALPPRRALCTVSFLFIHGHESEMDKNTSRKMHTLWSVDSREN